VWWLPRESILPILILSHLRQKLRLGCLPVSNIVFNLTIDIPKTVCLQTRQILLEIIVLEKPLSYVVVRGRHRNRIVLLKVIERGRQPKCTARSPRRHLNILFYNTIFEWINWRHLFRLINNHYREQDCEGQKFENCAFGLTSWASL